jgi:uncharacterized protein (DUF4415 family)
MAKSASSRLGVQRPAKSDTTGRRSRASGISRHGTDWDDFATRSEERILAGIADDPDAFVTDDAFWSKARVVRATDRRVVVVLNPDVARWFRKKKDGDAQLNALLRERMEAERRPPAKKRRDGR